MEEEKGLVARYLQAVRFWLPRDQQDDITAELAEDLQSKIEEQETARAHRLDEDELAALLKQTGSPVLVASRYLPQQSLIGPVLFPVYVFMLKMMALFYLLPWLLVLIVLAASHHRGSYLGEGLRTFWMVVLTSVGAMTIVFALLERYQAQTKLFETWDPRKLPAVRSTGQIKRSASIAEILVNAVLALWWANGWASAFLYSVSHVRIAVTPQWTWIAWGLVTLALVNIAMACANLMRPYWTRTRAWLRLALDGVGASVFCLFLNGRVLANVAAPGLSASQAVSIVHSVNAGLIHAFPVCVVASVVVVAVADIPRIVQYRMPARRPIGGTSLAP